MKELNEYGKGRKSVIDEMIQFIDHDITKSKMAKKEAQESKQGYKEATIQGHIQGLIKAKQRLNTKLNNLKTVQ